MEGWSGTRGCSGTGQADPAAIQGPNSQTGNRWEMWSESVLLFLFVEGNVTLPDFRCDLEN